VDIAVAHLVATAVLTQTSPTVTVPDTSSSGIFGTGFNPLTLLNFGVLGILVALLLFGWLWPKHAVDDLKKDKAKAEERSDAMIKAWQEQVLPALVASNAALTAIKPVIEDAVDVLWQTRPPGEPVARRRRSHPPGAGSGS
jgi:hypothetical protein